MPKSKYKEPLISDLLAHIANGETGSYACEQVGITIDTLMRWKRKPEFKARWEEALRLFRQSCPIDLKRKVRVRLMEVIEHGLIQTSKTVVITEKPILNEKNRVIQWVPYRRETTTSKGNMGTPQWVVDRVLPVIADLDQAIKIIEQHGFVIIPDPQLEKNQTIINELKSDDQGSTQSDKTLTAEEIDYLKQQALFNGKEPPKNLIDVPAKVVNEREPS